MTAAAPSRATLDQHAMMRRATRASLAVALSLALIKGGTWWLTDSVSILASLLDSLVDAMASGVTMLAVHASLQPADREHRFGHGKLEQLAGLGQAVLIAASACGLFYSAFQRLRAPVPVERGLVGVAVMAVASAATLGLVRYQRRVVQQTGSTAVTADSMHYTSDLLMNGVVALSLVLSTWLGWALVDPVLGLMVSVVIGRSAWKIGYDAVQLLMDREFPEADRQTLLRIVRSHPEVRGLHDLRTRLSGLQRFVQFHLELDGAMPLRDVHVICEQVEAEIRAAFPTAEVIVHADPDDHPPDGVRD